MERCEDYVGLSCVDGSCPVADGVTKITCDNCDFYKGCDDCAFVGTPDCPKYCKPENAGGTVSPEPDAGELPFG